MPVYKVGGIAFFASIALAACSGGGSSPGNGGRGVGGTPTPPPVVTKSYAFPAGNATASPGDTAWDITGVTTTLSGQFGNAGGNSYDTLRVDVTFTQNVANALPSPGAALATGNQLGVAIGLDTDANPNTGFANACASSSTQLPFEYSSDPGKDPSRLSDGNFSIIQAGGPIYTGASNPAAEAMTTINGNTFSQTFSLTTLGVLAGLAAPRIGIAVGAGNANGITDCVPSLPALEIFTT